MADDQAKTKDETPDSVASTSDNASLEHTEGGRTTRSDLTDVGVPMLPGDPLEPIGPEDAMGPGPKRGDYSDRIDAGPHVVIEPIPASEREDRVLEDDDGNRIGIEPGPRARVVDAHVRAAEQGDEPGKGGVPGTTVREAV
jgi:hypothetical protein